MISFIERTYLVVIGECKVKILEVAAGLQI